MNSHNGFLSYLQNSIVNSAHLSAHFCPALVCPQKAAVRIQFLPYFGISSSSRHEKCCQMLKRLFVLFHHSRNIPFYSVISTVVNIEKINDSDLRLLMAECGTQPTLNGKNWSKISEIFHFNVSLCWFGSPLH